MNTSQFKLGIYAALKNLAEADQHMAMTSLKLLVDKPVGIGDHSTGDYWDNVKEALDNLIDAEDRLEKLKKYESYFTDLDKTIEDEWNMPIPPQ